MPRSSASAIVLLVAIAVLLAGVSVAAEEEVVTCSGVVPMSDRVDRISIANFGSVGDGWTLNTKVFREAVYQIRHLHRPGGTLLYVPPGVHLTESFDLTSHMTLYLAKGAVIKATQDSSVIALPQKEPPEVPLHAMIKEKDGSRSPAPYMRLSGNSSENRARKGYVPVLVGKDEAMMERLDVPTKLMGHPFVSALLELSANEYGYEQPGLLRILYDADCFKQMIRRISKQK